MVKNKLYDDENILEGWANYMTWDSRFRFRVSTGQYESTRK